jgi:hypothetical protein
LNERAGEPSGRPGIERPFSVSGILSVAGTVEIAAEGTLAAGFTAKSLDLSIARAPVLGWRGP